jgi:hypothetical protein
MTRRLSPLVSCPGPNDEGCSSAAKVESGQICGECAFALHGSRAARSLAGRSASIQPTHTTTKGI